MIFFLLVSLTFDVVYPIGIIVTTFRFLFRSVPLARSLSFLSHFISLLFFINLNYIQLSVSHTRLLENHQYIYANFSDFANFKSVKLKPCARIKKKNFVIPLYFRSFLFDANDDSLPIYYRFSKFRKVKVLIFQNS